MIPAAAFVPLLYNPEGKPLVVHHSLVRWSRLAKKAIDTMDEQEQNACRKYGLGQLLEKCTKATGCPSAAPRAMATRFAPRTAFWCAVLDSAAQREMNAAKQEKANSDAAALLAKEKRKALEAVEQANAAMREAKRLQAAATAKYDQAEALLAQYGLANVPPQPTPPQKGAEATPEGEFGL